MDEKKILVVDDSVVNLKMAGKIIKSRAGWKPVLVPSGHRALLYLQENRADLILLDVMMPDMDGFQFLTALQSENQLAGIPVVMLTGDDDVEIRERSQLAGARDFLHKPFEIQQLLDTIAKYVD